MSHLAVNIIANLAGQGWSLIISLVAVPLYIKLLDIEGYGLIGFYVMVQGLAQVLDFGLSPTMNREMARYSSQHYHAAEARNLVRTLEVVYWAIAIVIGTTLVVTAPFIARHWLTPSAIPLADVEHALLLMGMLVALQWPLSLYGSGLMGLQKQLMVNIVSILMSTVSNGGAILVLWLVSPTIRAFFAWQIFVGAVHVAIMTLLMWRSLPPSDQAPYLDLRLLRNIRRFAAGMGGLGLSAIILTQLDKMILSRLLSLEMFGYYTLGGVLGRCPYLFITPVFNALFPRFSALVARNDEDTLRRLYHRGSQLMAALVIPVAAVVSLFSYDLLLLWTRDADAAHNAAPVASLLVIGTALNGLMNLPYALQLAYGWTQIGLCINSFFILTLVPAIVHTTLRYGPVGAASVWVALNATYILVGVPLTHRRLLKGEAWRWLRNDIGLPFLGALIVVGVGRWSLAPPTSSHTALLGAAFVLACSLIAAALAAPGIRGWVFVKLTKVRPSHT